MAAKQMLRTCVALCALMLSAPTSAEEPTSAGDPGFDVIRYSVTLRPDIQRGSVSGTETVKFTARKDLKAVGFSPNSLIIENAVLDGDPATISRGEQAVVFSAPTLIRTGQVSTLQIVFKGKPSRGLTTAAGVAFSSYFACDWMFCLQNSPGDKAWFDLDLYLPATAASVGIGRRLPIASAPEGLSLHRWRSSRAYSAYLFGFAAGYLQFVSQEHGGARLTFVNATGGKADLSTLFADTAEIADFFESKAGIPLPDKQYTQVLVSGDEAQEAGSFSLIGTAPLNRDLSDPHGQWVVAHEMAHQWWGNLVTCATWQDFWLNEGFATFMTAAWKQHHFGDAAYEAELESARKRLKRAAELGFDKPLAWGGTYPSLGVRRAVQYSKGALFLDRLRSELGESAFWEGVRRYTIRYAGKIVRSSDFQHAMEQASGRDLSRTFDEWVYGEP